MEVENWTSKLVLVAPCNFPQPCNTTFRYKVFLTTMGPMTQKHTHTHTHRMSEPKLVQVQRCTASNLHCDVIVMKLVKKAYLLKVYCLLILLWFFDFVDLCDSNVFKLLADIHTFTFLTWYQFSYNVNIFTGQTQRVAPPRDISSECKFLHEVLRDC